MTPQKAAGLFERVGNMDAPKSSLDRLPKALGERWEAQRATYEQVLREAIVISDAKTQRRWRRIAPATSMKVPGFMAAQPPRPRHKCVAARRLTAAGGTWSSGQIVAGVSASSSDSAAATEAPAARRA